MNKPVRILIMGASGMLGTAMLNTFSRSDGYIAIGAVRSASQTLEVVAGGSELLTGLNAESPDSLASILSKARPDVVVNCVGLIKQLSGGNAVASAVPINTLLPHRLQTLCEIAGSRLIHISTDCVFSGRVGAYREEDRADATDVYGLSKYLGEVSGENAVTLRTSIIGHELTSANGLVEWFLSQNQRVRGFAKAIFSGLPTIELARVLRDYVLPHPELTGLYHVSAEPIDKLSLLQLIADVYGHEIEIEPDTSVVIDRSLVSSRFRAATGYTPPAWPELVGMMKASRVEKS